MIETHVEFTGSSLAASLLAGWRQALATFWKVMPRDYKRALHEADTAVAAAAHEQVAHG